MGAAVNLRKMILLTIIVPLFLSSILVAAILGQIVQLLSELERIVQADRLIARVNATSRSLDEREAALLGWMVEGSPDLLRAYREANIRLDGGIKELARLASGNPERSGRLARLRGQSEEWAGHAEEMIAPRVGAPRYARRPGDDVQGRRLMGGMRDSLKDFLTAEERVRDLRTDATWAKSWDVLSWGTGAFVFLGSILAFAAWRLAMICGAAEAARLELQSRFESQEGENLALRSEAMKYYAIFRLDPEGLIRSWNEDAERILGYRADEVLGRRPLRFYGPEEVHRDVLFHDMEWASSVGRVEHERWVIRNGGFRFKALVATVATREADGVLSGYTVVVHEIQ